MSEWYLPEPEPNDDYLQRIAALESETEPAVRDQHVVSRVVLKGFAAPGRGGAGWQLTPFDLLRRLQQRSRGLRGCGLIKDFLPFASGSAERLWGEVENKLHPAIEAARAGRLHEDPVNVAAIQEAVALHLVRSRRYVEVHEAAVRRSVEEVRQEVLNSKRQLLVSEFLHRYGLYPAGSEALEALLDEHIARWLDLRDRGALARVSAESMFRRVCGTARHAAVEVWHTPPGHELLISDSPCFTFRYVEGGRIQANTAIGDSHGIALPLASDCLVALGPAPKDDTLELEQVPLFNRLQVEVGYGHVYYRPGSAMAEFVATTLTAIRNDPPA
jgi:hypothetical protein